MGPKLFPVAVFNFEEILSQFLEEQDLKPISKSGYKRRLRGFFRWLNYVQPSQTLTRETVLQYKLYLANKGHSSFSQSGYLTSVRRFFIWTEEQGIHPNIAKSVKAPRKPRTFNRDPLTLGQIHQLLASIDTRSLEGKRDLALINLMIRTGPRTIEIIRADIGDIRQEAGETVLWLQGKGSDSKDAFVVLTEDTLKPIQDYLSCRSSVASVAPLFASVGDSNFNGRLSTRSIRRIIKTRLRAININSPRISAHSLRHTSVTLALLGGATIQEAQQMARHADVNTTLIYAHNLNRAAGIPEKKIEALLSTR